MSQLLSRRQSNDFYKMLSREFLTQYITDLIKYLQHYLLLDKNMIDLYLSRQKQFNYTLDKNKYTISSNDEAILLEDFNKYINDIDNLHILLDIPLWFGNVIIKNNSGVNKDKRSIDSTKFMLSTKNDKTDLIYKMEIIDSFKYKFEGEFTVKELLVGYISVKFAKFDRWYEMFNEARININADGDLFIDLFFDHGY